MDLLDKSHTSAMHHTEFEGISEMNQKGKPASGRFQAMDRVYLCDIQHQRVRDSMLEADMMVSLVTRAVDDVNELVSLIGHGWRRLSARLHRYTGEIRDGADVERDAFLSRSVDVADLERRIRVFEQRSRSLAGWPHPTA
jgi:hypothetical protein